jgi:hypothetical protein
MRASRIDACVFFHRRRVSYALELLFCQTDARSIAYVDLEENNCNHTIVYKRTITEITLQSILVLYCTHRIKICSGSLNVAFYAKSPHKIQSSYTSNATSLDIDIIWAHSSTSCVSHSCQSLTIY